VQPIANIAYSFESASVDAGATLCAARPDQACHGKFLAT
jgi:hypothetical protein